ncbi:MAG: deoxyguanosinetriphosphate triphosphohydrolase, partial [Candidatus Desulfofervidus auxilii]|nr:deoxyguanosinetriphosphate triphosphohydrolase [Candidatus Desulfofervidus auxilii]
AQLYFKFLEDETLFVQETGFTSFYDTKERMVCDFIAGMTDRYALNLYQHLFLPKRWMVI